MDAPVIEEVWLRVGDRPVALHVLELGLACCGIEMREARRVARVAGALISQAPSRADGTGGAEARDGEFEAIRQVAHPGPPGAAPGPAAPAHPGRRHPIGPDEGALHVLVVAGTVTVQLAPVVGAAFEALPHPRAVLAFGACAATGGPYWDSYAVLPGAHQVVDVDAWVPGCPPRPADLLVGLEEVVRARA